LTRQKSRGRVFNAMKQPVFGLFQLGQVPGARPALKMRDHVKILFAAF
jgi:hypothetical protein